MKQALIKVRCPVCGDAIECDKNHLVKHSNKYALSDKVICYGSHLPAFQDKKGYFQVGKIMYIDPNVDFT